MLPVAATFNESAVWENANLFEIVESVPGVTSEVDGVHILAKVVGPAFFPETTSRNKVFYPLAAWETAISEPTFVARLADRLVYGTIGHNAELTDDDIREGRFSHIVIKVWINEDNVGMAEYLVLNTPPGRILNTLLRSGSRLRVSTKAEGYFENGGGRTKAVIPDSFKLDRIDFVIDPGYREALPQVTESLDSNLTNTNEAGVNMDKVVTILESRVEELKAEKTITESVANELKGQLATIQEAHAVANVQLANYTQLGTYASIQESISELEQYRRIGSVHEIHEALEQGQEVIDDMSGTITDLKAKVDAEPEEYQELGTPGDIRDALDKALDAVDELQVYRELGTPEELTELIAQTDQMAETQEQEAATACATQYGVDPSVVADLLGKGLTLEECSDILAKIAGPVTESEEEELTDEQKAQKAADDEAAAQAAQAQADADAEAEKNKGNEEEEEEEETNESLGVKLFESRSSKSLKRLRDTKAPAKIAESKKAATGSPLCAKLMTR